MLRHQLVSVSRHLHARHMSIASAQASNIAKTKATKSTLTSYIIHHTETHHTITQSPNAHSTTFTNQSFYTQQHIHTSNTSHTSTRTHHLTRSSNKPQLQPQLQLDLQLRSQLQPSHRMHSLPTHMSVTRISTHSTTAARNRDLWILSMEF